MNGGSCGMSCSVGQFGGVEFFTNSYVPALQIKHIPNCQNTNKKCQYTAQGELLCGVVVSQKKNETGTPLYEDFFAPLK
jgi:hypothetical protein